MLPSTLAERICAVLSPDLLQPKYRKLAVGKPREFGHCYVASEALYHLAGRAAGWVPMVARRADGTTHWWLQRGREVLDPTACQFEPHELPTIYRSGRRCGFLTLKPSKRAQLIINRVNSRRRSLKRS